MGALVGVPLDLSFLRQRFLFFFVLFYCFLFPPPGLQLPQWQSGALVGAPWDAPRHTNGSKAEPAGAEHTTSAPEPMPAQEAATGVPHETRREGSGQGQGRGQVQDEGEGEELRLMRSQGVVATEVEGQGKGFQGESEAEREVPSQAPVKRSRPKRRGLQGANRVVVAPFVDSRHLDLLKALQEKKVQYWGTSKQYCNSLTAGCIQDFSMLLQYHICGPFLCGHTGPGHPQGVPWDRGAG